MKCRFGDEHLYDFHEDDISEECFLCRVGNTPTPTPTPMLIVREVASKKMIHICENCLIDRCKDYLLDNTRPWEEQR